MQTEKTFLPLNIILSGFVIFVEIIGILIGLFSCAYQGLKCDQNLDYEPISITNCSEDFQFT